MDGYVNDGSNDAPKLLVYINEDNLAELPQGSLWPGEAGAARFRRLSADGFEGIQLTADNDPPSDCFLPHCGCDRINTPADADPIAAKHADRGHICLTVHAGWGLESDAQSFRLVEAIMTASERHGIPVFIETHRSTMTQDLWRTARLVEMFPGIRFNGDFSHYYTGQEMVYGGFEMKRDFMRPILDRIGFIHGRISSPGCMQVPVDSPWDRPRQAHGEVNYLEHFRDLWTRSMRGFLRQAGAGDCLIFAPELLSGRHYYARLFPGAGGRMVEETDRYQQALIYMKIARACFEDARRSIHE